MNEFEKEVIKHLRWIIWFLLLNIGWLAIIFYKI